MNTDLENTANEALKAIISTTTEAKDFILSELPDVIQQLLMWKMAESIVHNIIPLTVIIIVTTNGYKCFIWCHKNNWAEKCFSWFMPSLLFFVVGFIVSLIAINLVWLQIWVAPKVYLLEYAANLIK